MSEARELNMAKIAANVAELEEEQQQQEDSESRVDAGQEPQTQTQAKELSTERQITRLEKALEIAKSDSVKTKLKEEIELAKLRKQEEEQRKKEELETIQTAKTSMSIAGNVTTGISGAASNIADKTVELAGSATSTLATVSTPGSIFLPITILFLFFFLLLPVNGHTRAEWLWLALTGQAQIARGASGDFGPSTTSGGGDIDQPTTNHFYRVGNNFTNPYLGRQL